MATPHQQSVDVVERRPIRKWLVLAVCCLSVGVTGINLSSVNVALPTIGRELHASVTSLQWTVSAYSLVMACLLLLSGSMADRFGRRRVFQIGLTVFAVGSLLSGLAPSIGWLIGLCALQGVGASMLNPVALSILVGAFSDRSERARAIGVWGSVIGITIAAGPVLGGLLVSGISWRAVFWVNVPIALGALLLTRRFVPESRATRTRRFDGAGQVLIVIVFAAVIAATIQGPRQGWGNPWIITLFAIAAAALVALLVVEPRKSDPLIDLRFFRSPPFSGANLISVLMSAALGGFLFLSTLYLQDVRGLTALHAGVLIIPMAVGQAVAANLTGRVVAARGARLPLTVGGVLLAGGVLLLLPLTADISTGYLLLAYAIFGLGVGMISPAITNAAVAGLPADQVGVAGALAASARQFGSSIGVAVAGSIVTSTGPGFLDASRAMWVSLGIVGLIITVLGFASTSGWARAAAARNGEQLTAPHVQAGTA
jgi:EmrB/QacA subfamily drug resistance transporter